MPLSKEIPAVLPSLMVILRPLEKGIEEAVTRCAGALLRGDIIAFPTETFYGLGVKYDNPASLERLCALKNRPMDKAMPLIIGRREQLSLIASTVSPAAELLMRRFWPGPLTLILPAKKTVSHYITAGTGTVAVRVPGRSFALTLASALEFPITATSANISSYPPADCAEAVADYFGEQIDMVIDCGKTPGSLPSTIIDATGSRPFVVRHGVLPEEEIARALQA
jgi:L-threonylcarbamoyladenylate synthase